jgi:hypothetical protein
MKSEGLFLKIISPSNSKLRQIDESEISFLERTLLRFSPGNEEEFLDIRKTFDQLANGMCVLHKGRIVYPEDAAGIQVAKQIQVHSQRLDKSAGIELSFLKMRTLKIANLVFNPLLIGEVQCINSIVESNTMPEDWFEDKTECFLRLFPGLRVDSEGCGKPEGRLVRAVSPVVFAHSDSWTIVVATPDFESDLCWQEREKRETRALLFSYKTIAC